MSWKDSAKESSRVFSFRRILSLSLCARTLEGAERASAESAKLVLLTLLLVSCGRARKRIHFFDLLFDSQLCAASGTLSVLEQPESALTTRLLCPNLQPFTLSAEPAATPRE